MQQYKKVTGRTRADLAESSAVLITFQMSILWSEVPLASMLSNLALSGGYPLEIHMKRDTVLTKQVY